MPFDYEHLHSETQQTHVDFLPVELNLGPTFAHSALLSRDAGHMDHFLQAKQNAIEAAESVRRSMGRVEDVTIRTEIGEQLAELDRLISSL
jgi:hypothetical protein